MNSVVMAGSLLSFDVPSLLQAVSLSRQYTLIRLWDRERRPTGEIRLKAGQLIDAASAGQRGKQALFAILRFRQHYTFRVERVDEPGNLPEAVGPLARLLLMMPASAPPASPPGSAPLPTPSPAPIHRPPTLAPAPPPTPPPASASSSYPLVSDSMAHGRIASALEHDESGPVNHGALAKTDPRRTNTNANAGALPHDVVSLLERVDGLLVVLVIAMPQARCFTRWHRGSATVPLSALAGFATRWLMAHRQSFGSAHGRPQGTVELAEGTFVLDPVNEHRLIGYLFSSSVPAGMVKWRVSQLAADMRRFALDGESASGMAVPA